jgi:hypothetical protein
MIPALERERSEPRVVPVWAVGSPATAGVVALTGDVSAGRYSSAIWPRISPPGNWVVWTLA